MRSSTSMFVLGLAAAAFAQESSYTGPLFNPSEAPYFGSDSLVFPTQTTLTAIQPTNAFSVATTISGVILPSSMLHSSTTAASHSSSHSASSLASSSASRTASSTASSAATSASASAPAQQSVAAAVANRAGVMGAVAGGMLAGLALV